MCRQKCHFDKLSKSALRSALALLRAKFWTSKLWLSKSAASLPLPLAPCLPLAFSLPGATVPPGNKGWLLLETHYAIMI